MQLRTMRLKGLIPVSVRRRRGLSPVIATILLSAVVISVGGAVWSYAQGASTVIANHYVDGVLSLLEESAERFSVEQVTYNAELSELHVWIYNYGDHNISVDVYANNGTYSFTPDSTPIFAGSGESVCADISMMASSGDEIAVKVRSRRSNNAYYTYVVP